MMGCFQERPNKKIGLEGRKIKEKEEEEEGGTKLDREPEVLSGSVAVCMVVVVVH